MSQRHFEEILACYRNREAKVGIIGLGYVGLPLAMAALKGGFKVVGFDVDASKIDTLNAGRSYLKHISDESITEAHSRGQFSVTTDFSMLAEVDAILICVPTPLAPGNEPDLSFVISTTESITRYLRAGQLVVLESTTYPGTTMEVMCPILESSGLKTRENFYLAYSPEREDPGNQSHETSIIPKVVGGDGEEALQLACALYDNIVIETVPVSSVDTAEAVKLTENIFRSVNIALVNELKLIYSKMGIDVWEVIEAAKTKPFGYMPFYPGPGLGGHCIPIDPFYLTWRAKKFGQETKFIELAGEINTAMPGHVVGTLKSELLERFELELAEAKILLLGVAYKKNVEDVRESPAFTIIELLEEMGAVVDFYDPHVLVIPDTREHMGLAGRCSIEWSRTNISSYDASLIVTDHDGIDYSMLVEFSKLTVDARNATANVKKFRKKIALS